MTYKVNEKTGGTDDRNDGAQLMQRKFVSWVSWEHIEVKRGFYMTLCRESP